MTAHTHRIEEENVREKRKKNFDLAKAYIEQMHQLDDLQKLKTNPKSEIEDRVNILSPQISKNKPSAKEIADQIWFEFYEKPLNPNAKQIDSLGSKIVLGIEKPSMKEITSLTPQILEAEKTSNPTSLPLPTTLQPTDNDTVVQPPENLGEEASIEDANPESVQRKNLWEIWQSAADDLNILLKDLQADPFDSDAAQKVMLLCSHLASQMNHETARSLLNFIEETRIENLKKAYQPGWKEWGAVSIQLLGAIVGGFCGFVPAVTGKVGSSAKMWEQASQFCNSFLVNGASSLGQINSTVNQGKHSVVGHELESDKRLQQDLQQRRQQTEQAAKRELENITRMMQQKHETIRSINS